MNLDLQVSEPDVWPLAVQGPRAEDLVASVFGDEVRSVRYFSFMECGFHGRQLVVARSGYSKQGGFEIYLDDSALGSTLWDTLWEAGADLQVAPGCPNLIERIEAGLLSYGNEMTRENNPLEINLDRFCHLQGEIDYIGRPALEAIAAQGPSQRMRGLLIDGDPCPTCGKPWPIIAGDTQVGQVTSAIWSPAFRKNVGLSLIRKDHWNPGTPVTVALPGGLKSDGVVASLPFENPG